MKITYLFFILIIAINTSYAQEVDSTFIRFKSSLKGLSDAKKKAELLLDEGEKYISTDFHLAEFYITEANKYIAKKDLSNKAKYHSLFATIHRKQGNYARALQNDLNSYQMYQNIKDTIGLVKSLISLGVTNRFRNKDQESINYYNEALLLQTDSLSLANLYNLKGVAFHNLKQLDSAEYYYKKSLDLFQRTDSDRLVLVLKNNLAIFYLNQDIFNNVLPVLLEYLEYNKVQNTKMPLAISYHNVAYYYFKKKTFDKALVYADSSMSVSSLENFKFRYAKAIELKSNIYAAKGDYKNAFEANKTFNRLIDSIYNLESEKKLKTFELNKEFEIERRELQLKADAQKTKYYLYMFLISILLIGTLLIIYLTRKNYNNKLNLAAIALEKEILNQQLLDEKVKSSETELKWLIADNQMRVAYLQEFYNNLNIDESITSVHDFKMFLKDLRFKLNQQINTQEKLTNLQTKIKDVNKGFELKLLNTYPELTKSEREVCFLLRINLSIKEMASIRNSSIDSVKSIRYRLRKKLNLPKDAELEGFIKTL